MLMVISLRRPLCCDASSQLPSLYSVVSLDKSPCPAVYMYSGLYPDVTPTLTFSIVRLDWSPGAPPLAILHYRSCPAVEKIDQSAKDGLDVTEISSGQMGPSSPKWDVTLPNGEGIWLKMMS